MNMPLLQHGSICIAAICIASVYPTSIAFAEPNQKSETQAPSSAVKPVEDRDALLVRLTRILNYGSEVGGWQKWGKTDAVIALGLIGDERSVPVLIDHLQNEENNNLRLQIVRALGWIGSDTAVPALEQALKDPYPHVRRLAAETLRQMTGRSYEYDKTGVPDLDDLLARRAASNGRPPAVDDVERLDAVSKEVAARRERRVAVANGAVAPSKKRITEPVDMQYEGSPVGKLAETYADLSGKQVLVSLKAASMLVSLKIEKATRGEALTSLQKALKEAGIEIVEFQSGLVAFVPARASRSTENATKL